MRLTIPRSQDFWSGILFIVIAAIALYVSRDYPMGTARRMSAGYFPALLAYTLAIVGAYLAVRGVAKGSQEAVQFGSMRPFLVLLAVITFALLLKPAGFVAATIALVFISAAASGEVRLLETLIAAAALSIFAVVVFIWGLGLPLSIFPIW